MRAAGALILCAAVSACGQPITKPILVQRDPPPVTLTECSPEPPMPEAFGSEGERYAWAASAIFAGRDCRERLAGLKAWALKTPQWEP